MCVIQTRLYALFPFRILLFWGWCRWHFFLETAHPHGMFRWMLSNIRLLVTITFPSGCDSLYIFIYSRGFIIIGSWAWWTWQNGGGLSSEQCLLSHKDNAQSSYNHSRNDNNSNTNTINGNVVSARERSSLSISFLLVSFWLSRWHFFLKFPAPFRDASSMCLE